MNGCPVCGEPDNLWLNELTPGRCFIEIVDGTVQSDDYTQMFWDGQETESIECGSCGMVVNYEGGTYAQTLEKYAEENADKIKAWKESNNA